MNQPPFRLIAIGASAGGHKAVIEILTGISSAIQAAFMVVIHSSFDAPGGFASYLEKKVHLPVQEAAHNLIIEPGHVYVSVADQHLFVHDSVMYLSNGPRENLFRPAIDVLFRSAAVAYKNQCVGVLLTGRLNDGTAGLIAIKECGGIAIIQDPATAAFSDMPLSAQQSVDIDHVANLDQIPALIGQVVSQPLPPAKKVPGYLMREAGIALRIKSQTEIEESLGEQFPLSCPSCGGPLWKMHEQGMERFRCHVGHSFSQEALLFSQDTKLEETLWVALRTFEEKKTLMQRMAAEYRSKGHQSLAASYEHRSDEVTVHIDRLRSLMQLHE